MDFIDVVDCQGYHFGRCRIHAVRSRYGEAVAALGLKVGITNQRHRTGRRIDRKRALVTPGSKAIGDPGTDVPGVGRCHRIDNLSGSAVLVDRRGGRTRRNRRWNFVDIIDRQRHDFRGCRIHPVRGGHGESVAALDFIIRISGQGHSPGRSIDRKGSLIASGTQPIRHTRTDVGIVGRNHNVNNLLCSAVFIDLCGSGRGDRWRDFIEVIDHECYQQRYRRIYPVARGDGEQVTALGLVIRISNQLHLARRRLDGKEGLVATGRPQSEGNTAAWGVIIGGGNRVDDLPGSAVLIDGRGCGPRGNGGCNFIDVDNRQRYNFRNFWIDSIKRGDGECVATPGLVVRIANQCHVAVTWVDNECILIPARAQAIRDPRGDIVVVGRGHRIDDLTISAVFLDRRCRRPGSDRGGDFIQVIDRQRHQKKGYKDSIIGDHGKFVAVLEFKIRVGDQRDFARYRVNQELSLIRSSAEPKGNSSRRIRSIRSSHRVDNLLRSAVLVDRRSSRIRRDCRWNFVEIMDRQRHDFRACRIHAVRRGHREGVAVLGFPVRVVEQSHFTCHRVDIQKGFVAIGSQSIDDGP